MVLFLHHRINLLFPQQRKPVEKQPTGLGFVPQLTNSENIFVDMVMARRIDTSNVSNSVILEKQRRRNGLHYCRLAKPFGLIPALAIQ